MDEQRPARRIPVSQVFPLALQHLQMAKTILKKRSDMEPACGGWANMLFRTLDLVIHYVRAWENPAYLDERLASWERYALICPRCDYIYNPGRELQSPPSCPGCSDVYLVGPPSSPPNVAPPSPKVDFQSIP